MELNFDKEMDALLRQAARSGEIVSTNAQSHLDADEIAAFAENALPEKTRGVYIKHFADCDRCRTILSNTILLNSEAEIETASSTVSAVETEVVETKIPWYRKMFLMPSLAYTMGALVLVFGGIFGFLVLQNLNQTGEFNMARSAANRSAESGPNAVEDETFSAPGESNMANTMTNTSAVPANSMTAANANSSVSTSNSAVNAQTDRDEKLRDSKNETATGRKENDLQTDGASIAQNRAMAKTAEEKSADVMGETAEREDRPKITAATPVSPAAQTVPAPPPPPAKDDAETSDMAKAKRSAKREETTKQIGGKTFNRVGGVWIDSAYNRSRGANLSLPPTRTIRRGSSEYRKLDKQVRIIAESLEGAVIIVWKNEAYRIQ